MRTGQNWGRVKVRARISIRVNAGPGASRVGVSTSTVLKLVLILRDEGDADALVSGLLQNHKPEERHRLLPRCRGGVCRFHGPESRGWTRATRILGVFLEGGHKKRPQRPISDKIGLG